MLKSAVSSLQSLPGRWKETDLSVRRKRLVIALLIVLHILPLWVFKYFPSQDGPAHVYNSYVLSAFHDEDPTRLREYYKLNLTLFPNWSSHAFMSVLMHIFPDKALSADEIRGNIDTTFAVEPASKLATTWWAK